MSKEVVKHNSQLPIKLEDLTKFILIGREKLVSVRAEIRAIDKLGLAKEVREQKREEALNQLEEETQTDNIPRKVFGVARNSTKQGVHRRGSSFYVVDKN